MGNKYISVEAAIKACKSATDPYEPISHDIAIENAVAKIKQVPAADVVSAEDYKHLLKIANKMHLWIFNHTFDEQAAYDECGLTDGDNAMLGYGGQYILSPGGEDESAP